MESLYRLARTKRGSRFGREDPEGGERPRRDFRGGEAATFVGKAPRQ